VKPYITEKFHYLKTHPKKGVRITAGILLVIGGIFGALPVLGFWMLPLGLILLSVDFPWAKRILATLKQWWHRLKAVVGYRAANIERPQKD
jgi:hypothetical protein